MEAKKSAYITGGAGGLGRALAARLVEQGMNVFIADRDAAGAAAAAKELGGYSAALDATSWESQSLAFQQAVDRFGRIDYVFPFAGIGENAWTPSPSQAGDKTQPFTKPNLTVIDINVNGVLYTSSIAVQQFRRQTPDEQGFRGKAIIAGSFCGVYCCPGLPIYTTSKHAITGLVRSWGKALVSEGICLNSINPNVMKTGFSTDAFYDSLDQAGLLTPVDGAVEACIQLLGDCKTSGECFEIGPNYHNGQGVYQPAFPPIPDDKQQQVHDLLLARGLAR